MKSKRATHKAVETLKHDEASQKNIPTAEYQSVLGGEQQPIPPPGRALSPA